MSTIKRPKFVYELPKGKGFYFWHKGKSRKITMVAREIDSPAFDREYAELLAGVSNADDTITKSVARLKCGHINQHRDSVADLCVEYMSDKTGFLLMDPRAQTDRRRYINTCLTTTPEGHGEPFGAWAIDDSDLQRAITQPRLELLRSALPGPKRNLRADKSEAIWRDAHMTAMRVVFNWGIRKGKLRFNPFSRFKPLATKKLRKGWYTWTDADIAQYIKRWPLGTRQHLTLMLLLHTAVRRSDVHRLGASMLADDVLDFEEEKSRRSQLQEGVVKRRKIELNDELRAVLDATQKIADEEGWMGPWDGDTFITTEREQAGGRWSYTAHGIGFTFAKWCDQAGLPGRTLHGVRKHVATTAAELGMSDHHIAAVLGHSDTKNIKPYTEEARKNLMFKQAMASMRKQRRAAA